MRYSFIQSFIHSFVLLFVRSFSRSVNSETNNGHPIMYRNWETLAVQCPIQTCKVGPQNQSLK